MPSTLEDIHTLHRYFLWANRMRHHFRQTIQESDPPPAKLPELMLWLNQPLAYLSYWLATLFVVIEGWHELGLHDQAVDCLLGDTKNLDLLRRFRNGIYHFQRDYFDVRIREFLAADDACTDWADDLHEAISKFFLRWYEARGIKCTVNEEAGLIVLTVPTQPNATS